MSEELPIGEIEMGLDTGMDVDIRTASGISYSALKELAKGPVDYIKYKSGDRIQTSAMVEGSAFDCLMFTPDEFKDRFHVMTIPQPTEMMAKWVNEVIERGAGDFPTIEDVMSAKNDLGVYKTIKDNAKAYDKFNAEALPWLQDQRMAEGKTALTTEQYQMVTRMEDDLRANQYVKHLIDPHQPGCEVSFQEFLQWEYLDEKCKGGLDIVIFNNEAGWIQPIDLKSTGGSVYGFQYDYIKYKYYIQGAFYTAGLKALYPNMVIFPFKFLVQEKGCKNQAICFEMSENDIHVGQYGGKTSSGYDVKGFHGLIEDLKWHTDKDMWGYKREVYETKGLVKLESFESHGKNP